ncbi:M15 family metallopeptidase [Mycobacterium sp. DL592]|uniref:M15 family metallopeptidase n=1 Tax=Mycobacterium sp. DL592 TaxID=2675524 RepID=UPI001AAFA3A4|nr:M15 family metallopeptidase [Mycobacterium sp. DL592]
MTKSAEHRRLWLIAAATAVAVAGSAPAVAQPDPAAPADFVALLDVDPSILQEMRYVTAHNFTGDPVDGYRSPTCILTRQAADALHRAQQDFLERGYSLKVYDCYRPQRAVNDFVAWARDLADQRMKPEFYPRVDKSALFADGYIAEKSGHSRGSTVDLTLVALPAAVEAPYAAGQPLVDCAAPQDVRFPDNSIDMGTGFDCFDTLAHTLGQRVGGDELKNRLLLKEGLEHQGFVNYDQEWWHFTYQPEPYPDTYFDFPVDPSALAGIR